MHLRLCVGPSVDTWLSIHPIIIFFYLTLDVFSIVLRTKLGLSHPLVLEESHCIYNQPLDLIGIHLLHCTHVGARMVLHDIVRNVFTTIAKNATFHISQNKTHVLSPMPCNFHVVKLTLCYQLMVFACWQMLSLLISFKLIWFCGLLFLMGLCDNCHLDEKRSLLPSILDGHVSPFSCKGFGMFTLTSGRIFSSMRQHEMRNERHLKPSSFSFVLIS